MLLQPPKEVLRAMPIHRSLEFLNALSREFPRVWKQVEKVVLHRPKNDQRWPDWCFIPFSRWCEIAHSIFPDSASPRAALLLGYLAPVGTWRYSQGIYRFDPDVYEAIIQTGMEREMPSDVFLRLPEWCVYIESPGLKVANSSAIGFWARLEADTYHGYPELWLLFDTVGGLVPFILQLGPWTIAEAIQRDLDDAMALKANEGLDWPDEVNMEESDPAQFQPFLSLLLYLCSEQPEIGEPAEPMPSRPQLKRVKGGQWKLFPPSRPKIWPVGNRTGELIRQAKTRGNGEASGKTVRPHIRRAHWHGYWIGPRNGEQKFKFKWLAPIIVTGNPEREMEM